MTQSRNLLAGAVGLLAGVLLFAGCRSPSAALSLQRFDFREPHMGTVFTITLYAADQAAATNAAAAAFKRITALDRMLTDYDPESELMQLCQRPAGVPTHVSNDLFDVLQKAQRVAELSDGAFDVTVGPYVRVWRRARRTHILPSAGALADAGQSTGYNKLQLDARCRTVTLSAPNMQLDLGGIAKGYAADQALRVLKRNGIGRALVAASGDIAVGDPPPGKPGWRVGIGVPDAAGSKLAKALLLRNAAVSTSGDTEQFVEIGGRHYSHIVNPKTGIGLTERIQVSVIAKGATTTDAFATAVSVLGVKRGLTLVDSQPHLAALILKKDGETTEVLPSRRFKKTPEAYN